jgi:hypothetical protein
MEMHGNAWKCESSFFAMMFEDLAASQHLLSIENS